MEWKDPNKVSTIEIKKKKNNHIIFFKSNFKRVRIFKFNRIEFFKGIKLDLKNLDGHNDYDKKRKKKNEKRKKGK